MKELNEKISGDTANLGRGFCIGHSFFCPTPSQGIPDEIWYRQVIDTEILPLLEEYWFDDLDEINIWRERLLSDY